MEGRQEVFQGFEGDEDMGVSSVVKLTNVLEKRIDSFPKRNPDELIVELLLEQGYVKGEVLNRMKDEIIEERTKRLYTKHGVTPERIARNPIVRDLPQNPNWTSGLRVSKKEPGDSAQDRQIPPGNL
jgi:hypothetical protein